MSDSTHPSGDSRFGLLDKSLKRFRYAQDALIEILHNAQDIFGFLSSDLLIYIAQQLKLPPSRVYGVATFYHLFSFSAKGEHSCTVCLGTACFVKGADEIVAEIAQHYGLQPGETSDDGRLSLSSARCLGSCGLAPVLLLDGEVIAKATRQEALSRVTQRLGSVLEAV
jgi:bidirectional [NiFe] hydrogenase diaphorase subunit